MLTQVHDFVDGVELCPNGRTINVTLNDALAAATRSFLAQRVQADLSATLTTNVRSRAESAHGVPELLRIEKEPVWCAVYPASRVRVPKPACSRVWVINRADAFIARSGRARISANAVRHDPLTVHVQLRSESTHNFTNSCCVRIEEACGVPPAK